MSSSHNPFQSPTPDTRLPPPAQPQMPGPPSAFAPCPKCGTRQSKMVGFSWWGGVIGPKILTHVKCPLCRTTYNGKTGQSNTKGIIIYSVVMFVLMGSIAALLIAFKILTV